MQTRIWKKLNISWKKWEFIVAIKSQRYFSTFVLLQNLIYQVNFSKLYETNNILQSWLYLSLLLNTYFIV